MSLAKASVAARAASAFLRQTAKPRLAAARTLEAAAEIITSLAPAPRLPEGVVTHDVVGGVACERVAIAGAAPQPLLLYLHGGGYFAGAPQHYRAITYAFAQRGFEVVAPDYRLAPAAPFPAALDDARAVYEALRRERSPILLAGDSAGGGLTAALMASLKADGAALPAAAVLFSPWTDLAVTGPSARENEAKDCFFTRALVRNASRAYLCGASARNPLASPLYADLTGLPPLLIHAGADEMLRDDSTRLAARAQEAGVSVEIALWPVVPHVWQMGVGALPEAAQSLDQAAAFLHAHRK